MLWRPRLSDTRKTLVDHIVCTVVLVIPSRAFCSASEIAVWSRVEQISCLGVVWLMVNRRTRVMALLDFGFGGKSPSREHQCEP